MRAAVREQRWRRGQRREAVVGGKAGERRVGQAAVRPARLVLLELRVSRRAVREENVALRVGLDGGSEVGHGIVEPASLEGRGAGLFRLLRRAWWRRGFSHIHTLGAYTSRKRLCCSFLLLMFGFVVSFVLSCFDRLE